MPVRIDPPISVSSRDALLSETNVTNEKIAGVILPVTTPFDPVTGDVAPVAMRDNLRRWSREPIDGFVLFGSTGEGAMLDTDEKVRLARYAREVVPPETLLIAGANTDSTRGTIHEIQRLAAEGVEAVLVHTPVYFAPALTHAAILEFFRAVADASPVPVLVYHMPKFTHVTIDPPLMGEITRLPNIAGLKDSSGDIKRFAGYTEACPAQSRMLVGSGALFYTALELGAVGGILAVADLAPALAGEIFAAFRAGETRRAGELQQGLSALHNDVIVPFGARGVKLGLDAMGWAGGPPRAPLPALTTKESQQVLRALQTLGIGAAA
jgi:4-hydroxy-2-oxoglutarate aldolase